MNRMTSAAGLGCLAAALIPASASAQATITTDKPCYVENAPMLISGGGFLPGSSWTVKTDQIFAFGTTDPAGAWNTGTEETAPINVGQSYKPKTFTLTATQDTVPVATAAFKVVNFAAGSGGGRGKPTKKVKWRFSGFLPGQTIYIHIKRGSSVWTQKVGKGSADCGTASKRLRRLPAVPTSRISNGVYKVFVDNKKKYKKGGYQLQGSISVFTTFNN